MKRNISNMNDREHYESLYDRQKKKAQQKTREELTRHEKKSIEEIKETKNSRKKMWNLINKLRRTNQKEKETGIYNEEGNKMNWDMVPD